MLGEGPDGQVVPGLVREEGALPDSPGGLGKPDAELREYLARSGVLSLGHGASPGTPGRFVRLPSGLDVPDGTVRPSAPIDQVATYLTATEVLGEDPGLRLVLSVVAAAPLDAVLGFASELLGLLYQPNVTWEALDRAYAQRSFRGDALARAVSLLDTGRRLLFPQGLLLLVKLALVHSPDAAPPSPAPGLLSVALLTLGEHLGAEREEDPGTHSELFARELVSNQHFHAPRDPAHLSARFARRWLQLPRERASEARMLDLEDCYREATGVALRDVMVVALGLWSAALEGINRIWPSYFDEFGWDQARLGAVLDLLSADRDTLRDAFLRESRRLGANSVAWVFSPLEQYPLLRRSDGSYVVISPRFVFDRVFGWLPFFDVRAALRAAERKADAKRFEGCFQHVTELYAREVLDALAPSGVGARRVYDEVALKAAYARPGVQIADAALDYGLGWVVVEISTHQLTREGLAGANEVADELAALVEKAAQVHSTIEQIRANETKLTGCAPIGNRRFLPIVVVTEGFPVNPITLTKLREQLVARSLLQSSDTGPLELLSLTDLEIVEAIQEQGGQSLRELLEAKSTAGLANDSFRNYLVVERRIGVERSRRVDGLWMVPFDIVGEVLGREFEKPPDPAGPS